MAHEIDPAVSRYITMVQHLPRLSREEELEICSRWQKEHDERAKDQLVRGHLRYVVAIALKYRRYGLPLAELIAEGNFGVVHALRKFEPERGNRFVTYAAYWIRAYILNYIIRSWSLVGVGSGALRSKMFFKLRRERVRITNLVGEGEEADELLAQRFDMTRTQVVRMVRRLEARDVSLDAKVFDDSTISVVDTIPSATRDQESAYVDGEVREQVTDAVRCAIGVLDPRERYIVHNRMMADGDEELSLAEIGRRLGVSRERARQLEARAKRKLRARITELCRARGGAWLDENQAA
ncbi:MAG TPA: RNA polymerase factor sigma-32 [Polyangiaceae bacterium]|nr:RNA polymerase factor sigma-32 [Polyangiaceae bacterium]